MIDKNENDGQETNEGNVEFPVNEWNNKPENNLLEKARYKFKVIDAVPHTASSGNECVKITFNVEGKRITDYLIRCDAQGKKHSMTYKFHNFLFAIGIRNTNKKFTISKNQMVGKEGLCDVSVKKDGSDNQINGYSPIEEATAPMNDVPPEGQTESLKETQKEKSSEEESVDDL